MRMLVGPIVWIINRYFKIVYNNLHNRLSGPPKPEQWYQNDERVCKVISLELIIE